jgi:hypothetical protein
VHRGEIILYKADVTVYRGEDHSLKTSGHWVQRNIILYKDEVTVHRADIILYKALSSTVESTLKIILYEDEFTEQRNEIICIKIRPLCIVVIPLCLNDKVTVYIWIRQF